MKRLCAPHFEKVPMAGAGSVVFREFRQRAFAYPWHEHPEAELTWIVRGRGLRYVGDSVAAFGPGDFCLIGANVPHTWLSKPGGNGGAWSRVIQFDPALWGCEFRGLPECARIDALLMRAAHGIVFQTGEPQSLFENFRQEGSLLRRLTALLETLEVLSGVTDSRELSLSPWGGHARRPASGDRLARLMAFLGSHSDSRILQSEAAEVAGLTPSAFSRFFRRTVGKTYQDYLCELKLGHACRLLMEAGLSIAEIAYASGFSNLSTFNRSFRLKRGISPREFRKLIKESMFARSRSW